jgi:hypothetical protein
MACKQSIPALISCKLPSLRAHLCARSLAGALTLGAGVALSARTAAVSSATAQELEWATSAGGVVAAGRGIATTPRGESYVTGEFRGTAVFGQGEPNETTLTAVGLSDVFIAKYDRDGALLWATRAGGSSNEDIDGGLGIATTPSGESYVTGRFAGPAVFGQGEPNETTLTAAGRYKIFVAKYDRDGALLWPCAQAATRAMASRSRPAATATS